MQLAGMNERDLKELAEAFYVRLAGAGCQPRDSVKVVNHLLTLLTNTVAGGAAAPTLPKRVAPVSELKRAADA